MKKPKNAPSIEDVGARVQLRGRPAFGELYWINPESEWCLVAWNWESYNQEIPKGMINGFLGLDELIKL